MNFTENSGNPWFGVSMLLIGVIIGYGIAAGTNAGFPSALGDPSNIAAAPTPSAPAPAPEIEAEDVAPVDPEADHIRGDPNAKISLIEYSDFECPFCARHHPTAQKVVDDLDDVNWVYRHFPLSFHPNAQISAEASECAAELGGNDKFWEFADTVFEKGANKDNLVSYAVEIGLNEGKFQDCLDSGKHAQKVKDQMAEGSTAGVSGTPGNIVINNVTGKTRMVSGAQPFQNFETAIEAVR